MDFELRGKRAIVTGGSRDIGRAIVEEFARQGCAVEFCARNSGDIEQLASDLTSEGYRTNGTSVDVSDGAALTAWVTLPRFDVHHFTQP